WRFYVDDELVQKIPHLYEEKKPKYSRAVLETLAIIAYHQPVTRGQIEDIRGIQVSSTIMQTLSDRGWIEVVAYKDSPGKPALWATSKIFLQDFRLNSLSDLPSTEELGHLLEQQSN
ncbi:MAG: SMC-Scp complex subunit ScpB, partial [Neisseriaceae bacterium]|nr:SMC-Scp complex subunit ScpB [Neisseriaceae bacterium]